MVGNCPVGEHMQRKCPRMSDSAPVPVTQRTSGDRGATWPATPIRAVSPHRQGVSWPMALATADQRRWCEDSVASRSRLAGTFASMVSATAATWFGTATGIEAPELPSRHALRAGEPAAEAGPVLADAAMAGVPSTFTSATSAALPEGNAKECARTGTGACRSRESRGRATKRAGCPGAILEAAEARSRERRIEPRGRMRYTGTTTTSR